MKVFVILSRVPYPLEKGDKLRAFHHIKALSSKHRIILCCLNDGKLHPDARSVLAPFCEEIHIIPLKKLLIFLNLIKGLFTGKPFQVQYFYQKQAQKKIDELIDKHLPGHIFLQLIRTAEYAKKYRFIPVTFDYMDAFSTGVERRIKYSIPGIKQLFVTEAERLKLYEADVFKFFRNKIIISEQDRDLIRHPDKNEIHIVPNGVDMDFFNPHTKTRPKYDIVFVGNMSYPPNIRAATYLVKTILPELRKHVPNVTVNICGANPAQKVKNLASERVHVQGWIEDIREAYSGAEIFAAPMQIGTGLQNKLLEAMAMRKPCITSSLANKALGAKENEEILIGNSPEDYAEKIAELLRDDKHRNKLADTGLRFVQSRYDWSKNAEILLKLIAEK